MDKNTYVLFMAGGLGSRFWPKSREKFPKQFIDILGTGESLLQQTVKRFDGVCDIQNMYVLTNSDYFEIVKQQIPELPSENILLEPTRNNTAPCIAYACYKIFAKDANANIVISPSDHLILKTEEFRVRILQAVNFAYNSDALVTLGITPTRPDTGYGYIKYATEFGGVFQVEQFLEKPILELAKQYVDSGKYLWNAGIFIWNVKSIISAFEKYAPEIATIFNNGIELYNTVKESEFIFENYPNSPNISIDYAIMEKADNVYTIPTEIGWSDLGTWASLYEVMEKDEFHNTSYTSSLKALESTNCMVHLPKEKVALIKGLNDYIIVDDGKVLVIVPKAEEQNIKGWSKEIIEKFGQDFS